MTGEAARSSKHFVLGAFIIEDASVDRARDFLAQLRREIGRSPGNEVHWNQIVNHGMRRHLTQSLGEQDWLRLSTVIVCRDLIPDSLPSPQVRYQFTLRFLLERLSWFAASRETPLHYTLSHWRGMREEPLRLYEQYLRANPGEIRWDFLDRAGATVSNNTDEELLQFGDITASATAAAFERDRWGFVESDYLRRMLPRFYRHRLRNGTERLLSYGLKLHPNSAQTTPGYEWVAELQ